MKTIGVLARKGGAGKSTLTLHWAVEAGRKGKNQTPPDLVVKFQPIDIADVILWLVLQPGVVYQREIKG